MTTNNTIILQDVFFHLANLKSDFARHEIEHNKNLLVVYAMNYFTNSVRIIEQILKSYDNHNLKLLTNNINLLLLDDPELHCINVLIKKTEFLPQIDHTKTALITRLI